ncbi:Periodic tryptophan protein 2-like protein [Diplonema papillatum]|nr:Periodic tryptophan protein 2-like protein [Diplonema papillatum]
MRSDFKFLNLFGGVYSQGNVLFANEGKELLSPVGNRITTYDLVRSSNKASGVECLKDIVCMDLSHDETLLVAVDEDGRAMFVNWAAQVPLEVINFKQGTSMVKISPNDRYIAVANGRQVQVWSTPPSRVLQYRSVHLLKRINVCSSDVTSMTWSACCRYLLIGSEDCAVRIIPLRRSKELDLAKAEGAFPIKPHVTLAVHRCPVVNAFFTNASHTTILSASSDRTIALWEMTDRSRLTERSNDHEKIPGEDPPATDGAPDEIETEVEEQEEEEETEDDAGEDAAPQAAGGGAEPAKKRRAATPDLAAKNWQLKKRFFLEHDARLQVLDYHRDKNLLYAGFKNGVFGIYTLLPEVKCIHTLSITEQKLSAVSVNKSGEWVAFGSSKLGQLLVWEWRSETYVLKQQSHYHDVSSVAFSPDGSIIATSGDDGKVKVWNGSTGFCFATLRDHQGPVSGVKFSNNTTLWSCSADGTCRGYDLRRYRQFRVLQPPVSTQLSSLSIDPSGELIACGSVTEAEVFLWSAQTGQLLEAFSGHEAPVSSVDFHVSGTVVATGSWDKTARLWEVYASHSAKNDHTAGLTSSEALRFNTEVVAVKFSPNGHTLCVLTLSGDMSLFDTEDTTDVTPLRSVSTHRDVKGGWRSAEATNPFKSALSGRFFDSISWFPDSSALLLAGNSKWIALYSAAQSTLLKKWSVTNNRSMDGMSDVFNHRAVSEAGNLHNLDLADSDSEDGVRKVVKLPGAQRGDQGKRKKTKPTARSKCVFVSPTGKEWAAATTDGLLLYSTEVDRKRFNPLQLTMELTPMDVYGEIEKTNYVLAVLKALRLNNNDVSARVFHAVPFMEIPFVSDNIPTDMLVPLLDLISSQLADSNHVERCLRWSAHLLHRHGAYIQKRATAAASGAPADGHLQAVLKHLHQHVAKKTTDLMRLTEQNKHTLAYLSASGGLAWYDKKKEEAKLAAAAATPADILDTVGQLGHKKKVPKPAQPEAVAAAPAAPAAAAAAADEDDATEDADTSDDDVQAPLDLGLSAAQHEAEHGAGGEADSDASSASAQEDPAPPSPASNGAAPAPKRKLVKRVRKAAKKAAGGGAQKRTASPLGAPAKAKKAKKSAKPAS